MCPPRLDIDPVTHAKRLLLGFFVFRIRNSQLAFEDQMRGKPAVRVRTVVGIAVANLVSFMHNVLFAYRSRL